MGQRQTTSAGNSIITNSHKNGEGTKGFGTNKLDLIGHLDVCEVKGCIQNGWSRAQYEAGRQVNLRTVNAT